MRSIRSMIRYGFVGAAAAFFLAAGAPAEAGEMAPNLKSALAASGPDDLVPVVVLMEEFPDRNALMTDVRGSSRDGRRAHVVSSLKDLAQRSQVRVHSTLAEAADKVRDIRVLWGINGVALRGTPKLIDRLAALPQVRWVLYDHAIPMLEPTEVEHASSETGKRPAAHPPECEHCEGPTGGDTSGPNPDADVVGEVIAMGAKQVWDDLGWTGAGVIVAVIDTGIDPTHPDLADHMWANLDEVADNGIDDDGNGYVDDTWGWEFCLDNNSPDGGSHGTQVAGQVGGDGTNGLVTGMAPDVELMALGIDCDTPSKGWEASDYALENGAHIITQSYSWWWTDQPDYEAFRRQTDVELAAGVIHANSAGNHGGNASFPVPYNISTPANCPAPWIHPDQIPVGGVSSIVAVGNIDWFSDVIASHSSRGPAAWEDIRANTDPDYPFPMAPEYQDYPYENGSQPGLIKPDISAYGQGTETTCPGPSYCQFSGTSSATPHVAGTLALMLSANPGLTPAELAQALLTTAEHRGAPGKNNDYGVGLVQAFQAVDVVESGVVYESHAFDDTDNGNGDLALDPGERVIMPLTVRSLDDTSAVGGLEVILSTATPGVTIHDQYATFPVIPALGTAETNPPHFSLTLDPAACSSLVAFDLELRFGGNVRRSTFYVRVGDETPVTLLADDFETDTGWISDPGTASEGTWERGDPIGVQDGQGRFSSPEDDSSDPGVNCWVTDNGGGNNENRNDVDGGSVYLISPPFGSLQMLSLDLTYDRWYYDTSGPAADAFRTELSNDGGATWTLAQEQSFGFGGWETQVINLFAVLPSTDDMRLRFVVSDGIDDSPVEGGVDELYVDGIYVDCQTYTPTPASPPNPVGDTVLIGVDAGGHTVVSWDAPPVDGSHDAATLYRIERATSPNGTFVEAGSSTVTSWFDVDALRAPDSFYYRVVAENSGGTE